MAREQYKIIRMTEFLIQQEIRPDWHTTLTWYNTDNTVLFPNHAKKKSDGDEIRKDLGSHEHAYVLLLLYIYPLYFY